jgi:hypothetical protein
MGRWQLTFERIFGNTRVLLDRDVGRAMLSRFQC